MADRIRRARRMISDATDESSEDSLPDSEEDFDPRKLDSMRRAGKVDSSAAVSASSRSKRSSAGATTISRSGASIQRSVSNTPDDKRQSLKLTVKAPPSKLREVVRANELESLQDTLGGGHVLDGPRNRRRAVEPPRTSIRAAERPRYAEYAESELDDEEEEEEEEDDEEEDEEDGEDEDDEEDDDDPAAKEDEVMNDFEQVGAEAEGGTDEEDDDVEMEDAPIPPKPPRITLKPPAKTADPKRIGNPRLVVSPPKVGPVKSVEQQEIEDDPGDSEVDESSDADGDEDNTKLDDEDGEGEDEELEEADAEGGEDELDDEEELGEEDDEDEDDEDSDDSPMSGSATPDLAKLTKRQRGRPEDSGNLLALDMAPQQRKFFTDAEKAMKKDEHARKRKELTKRKVQEEKTAALNRLLKPQANKARGAAPKPETLAAAAAAAAVGSAVDEEEYVEKPNPLYTRWISDKNGLRLGVPDEWLGKRVGAVFGPPMPVRNGSLVQEIE